MRRKSKSTPFASDAKPSLIPHPEPKPPRAPARAFGATHVQAERSPWSPGSAWGRDSKSRMLRAGSSWVLNDSRGWRHKCSGKPVPMLSHPYSQIDFLVFKWNFLCFSSGPLSLFLSLGPAEKRLLQLEQSQLHQPLPEGQMLPPRHCNYSNSSPRFQYITVHDLKWFDHPRRWTDLYLPPTEHMDLNYSSSSVCKMALFKRGPRKYYWIKQRKHCTATPWKWHRGFPPLSGNYQLEGSVEKQSDVFHSLQRHSVI